MATRCRQHAPNIGLGHGAPGEIDICDEAFTAQAPARHGHHDRFKLHAGHAYSNVDCLTGHFFGFDQINNRTALHTARRGMGKSQKPHAVAAPAQDVLWCLRLEPRDQADDLAGANIECGDNSSRLKRKRFHFSGEAGAEHRHASPPLPDFTFFAFSASLRAWPRVVAAASDCRTVTRSDSLRSTAVMSRDSSFLLLSRSTRVCSDRPASPSGSRTSTPPLRCKFHRRSATSTDASVI